MEVIYCILKTKGDQAVILVVPQRQESDAKTLSLYHTLNDLPVKHTQKTE